jgi:hypothetical protein
MEKIIVVEGLSESKRSMGKDGHFNSERQRRYIREKTA